MARKSVNGNSNDIKIEGQRGYKFENWSKTFTCNPELFFEPQNIEEIKSILRLAKQSKKKIRISGNGHSPSDIPCTDDYMVSLKAMNKIIQIDKKNLTVKCEAGIETTELNEILEKNDLCLSILGSISDATIAGMLITAYHGSGINHKCLTSTLLDIEVLTADGEIVHFNRENNEEEFRAACVSMGCIGIVLSVTIQCEKLFSIRQSRHLGKLTDVLNNLDSHLSESDHFKFYWIPHTEDVVVDHQYRCPKNEQKVTRSFDYLRDVLLNYHLLQFLYWICLFIPRLIILVNNFVALLFRKPRLDFDIGYKIFNFDCLFSQHVMEWAFPLDKTANVLYELKAWLEKNNFYAHSWVEVRFTAADDLILSPSYGRKSAWINTIMLRPYFKEIEYERYWKAFEEIARKYGARPHWAKPCNFSGNDFRTVYSEWDKFRAVRDKYDPKGMFLNQRLQKIFVANN